MSYTYTDETYDYSQLKVNNSTPSAVKVNNTDCYRLKVNNTDVIHKDITQRTYYEGNLQLRLQYKVVISRFGTWSDCDGSYSDGRADITITPVIVDSSGDIHEVTINKLTTNQKITLKIGSDTVDINSGTTTTTTITRRIDWTYNYDADALIQVNSTDNRPFILNTTVDFDLTIGVQSVEDDYLSAGSTAGSRIGSFSGNGTYYFYTPIAESDPDAWYTESWRDY